MISRFVVDMMRANTLAFNKQQGGDTTALMPMLPKRVLLMIDTIDELYDEAARLRKQLETPSL